MKVLSEKNAVVVLFVMVLVTFSFAQEDSKKMEKGYTGFTASSASKLASLHKVEIKTAADDHSANIVSE